MVTRAQHPRHNLPAELSSFIGRRQELGLVRGLLGTSRLVTLTGPGGVGKTRLCLQVARAVVSDYPDGVGVVHLAPLADPLLVPQAVAAVVGVRERPGRPLLETLIERLHTRRMLLVLDNCEHLVAACAELAKALLQGCPDVAVVATSREPLRLEGESIWPVLPLSLPSTAMGIDLAGAEAIQLFVERAHSTQPGFALSADNAAATTLVCSRLDGIPLAIELAAARLRALSVEQVAARLDDAMGVLSVGVRTALPRHQTLRATLDWSFELCAPVEQRFFTRLSVFSGGWTLEAAEAVCLGDGIEPGGVLDLLGLLVDRSLVCVTGEPGATRYRLLETLRQYGQERLDASGASDTWRDRHAEYFLALAEGTESLSWGPRQREWWRRLDLEVANLRAALRWFIVRDRTDAAMRLGAALSRFWKTGHFLREGQSWYDELLAMPEVTPTVAYARLLDAAGEMAGLVGDFSAGKHLLEQAAELCHKLQNAAEEANARFHLGQHLWFAGELRAARVAAEQARELSANGVHDLYFALSLYVLGGIAYDEERYADSRELGETALSIFLIAGYGRGIGVAQQTAGRAYYQLGELEKARTMLESSADGFGQVAWPYGVAWDLLTLGWIATDQGACERAARHLERALQIFQELDIPARIHETLEAFAQLAVVEGQPRQGLRLAAAAAAYRTASGVALSPRQRAQLEPHLARARRALGPESAARAWSEGASLSMEQASREALARRVRRSTEHTSALTKRELEVAAQVAQGRTSRQIADALIVVERTVETHLERIYAKLEIHSRAQLATWLAEQNIQSPESFVPARRHPTR